MTPEQEQKQVARKLRTIAVEAVAPLIAAEEEGMEAIICLVGGHPEFVWADGNRRETTWDFDQLEDAQIVRWLRAHPERVHPSYESALTFARGRIST